MGSGEFAETETFGGRTTDGLTLTVGADSMTVDLSAGLTLSEIRDAVNSAADNPGVTATILNTGDGNQRLILTADESGFDKRVELSYEGLVQASDFGFTTTNQDGAGGTLANLEDLDASYSIDGFALTSASNNAAYAIDGLSIELKGVGATTLRVSRDSEAIEASAQAFVDAYNEVLNTIDTLRGEGLSGDSTLTGIRRAMRNTLNAQPVGLTGSYSALSQIGIKTNADTGQLEFNSADFGEALDADFNGVAQVFANDNQGFAFRFDQMADYYLDGEGPIDGRVDGLNDRIRRLEDREASFEQRLELKEKALRAQYAALDTLVGNLQATSNFLFSQLGV